jgi:SAM-dependent methyltransferase
MAYNTLIHSINERIATEFEYAGLVIDLGCGTAPYRDIILRRATQYVGVDWPASAHDAAAVDVMADVSADLPFASGRADVVLLFQTLEHLRDPGSCLRECRRLLKQDGRLYITVPFMWQVHEAPHDYYRFTRHGLTHLLEAAGFHRLEIVETTGFWQTLALKVNYHTYHRARRWQRVLLQPLWWLGQKVAPVLDRYDPHPEETASYRVSAMPLGGAR